MFRPCLQPVFAHLLCTLASPRRSERIIVSNCCARVRGQLERSGLLEDVLPQPQEPQQSTRRPTRAGASGESGRPQSCGYLRRVCVKDVDGSNCVSNLARFQRCGAAVELHWRLASSSAQSLSKRFAVQLLQPFWRESWGQIAGHRRPSNALRRQASGSHERRGAELDREGGVRDGQVYHPCPPHSVFSAVLARCRSGLCGPGTLV